MEASGTVMHSRRYMSKSQRACDFCRERKSACRIEGGAPCQLCSYYKRQCTFNSSSAARRKRVLTNATDNNIASVAPLARPGTSETGLGDDGSPILGMQNNATPPDSHIFDATMQSYDIGSSLYLNDNILANERQDGSHPISQAPDTAAFYPFADWINSPSQLMEGMEGMQAFDMPEQLPVQIGRYCGLTGDMDPYLLRLYRFNQQSVFPFKKLTVRSIDAGQFPIQFLQDIGDDSHTGTHTLEPDKALRAELEAIIPRSIGERFISL